MSVNSCAVPLCLPNNCKWNEQTGEYSKDEDEERSSLYVTKSALEQLKTIEGPVCVVSIAGPLRKGKSYILGKVFDQGEVFPLGHELDPETMGIWMWIVPQKFQDANGQEFTVVLLDSEGIDAACSEDSDDHCIFTLTILLASVLIYNSAGVPTRTDLTGLDYIAKLSQRIQMCSDDYAAREVKGSLMNSKIFYKTFPFFMWLLRDVTLTLPKGCHTMRDYFITKVFNASPSKRSSNTAKDVAESIIGYFPGFDAFKLPPPSTKPEVVANLNRDEVRQEIDESFCRGVDEFKRVLKSKLAPKYSFNDGELVTGEALASMVTSYVSALNTPGTVPNVQKAWDVFVASKCKEAKEEGCAIYREAMKAEMSGKLPCERDVVRKAHMMAFDEALNLFKKRTSTLSTASIDNYFNELTAFMEDRLNRWQEENTKRTKEICNQLLMGLKRQHLNPVLTKLNRGQDGAQLSFAEIVACYNSIEQGYKLESRGAQDVCAQVFYEFHPQLQAEMKSHMEHLQQLKDFDENLAIEKAARAQELQERKKVELELLKVHQKEERRRLEDKFKSGLTWRHKGNS